MEVILKNLKHKICSIFITSLFLIQICFGMSQRQFVRVVNDNTSYPQTRLDFTIPDKTPLNCQTLTYLTQPTLRKQLEDFYAYKISAIGSTFFENLINTVIEKEIELKDDYYVFYHGKKLEWFPFDDLLDALNKLMLKKNIKDFFLLRIPDEDNKKFKNISDFLTYYKANGEINDWNFDEKTHIQKLLLSVNPSLFGNNRNWGECTFSYFLHSENANSLNIQNFIKDAFKFFKVENLYKKYENKIINLVQLLSNYDPAKTGLLLQIFIPKTIINEVAYRCIPWGKLYYQDPEFHPASIDADKYQNNTFSYSELLSSYTLDGIQFRLLINEKTLNPNSKTKMFRYYNETENVKEYKKELQNLVDQISKDVLKKPSKSSKK